MFARFRTFINRPFRFYQALRNAPFMCDLALAAALVPICTFTAYYSHDAPLPYRDWHYDRLIKRSAYYVMEDGKKCIPSFMRSQYCAEVNSLLKFVDDPKKIVKVFKALHALTVTHQQLASDENMRKATIDENFMGQLIKLLELRPKLELLNLNPLLLQFYLLEESAAHLLLLLSLDQTQIYKKYEPQITSLMQAWRTTTPYTLKAAFAESYFHNLKGMAEVRYDGKVVPMNPERVHDFSNDILFIHGQQSHCFNSWRILKQDGVQVRPGWKRTYQVSSLWPQKFLNDKYNSRLLSLNYSVNFVKFRAKHRLLR